MKMIDIMTSVSILGAISVAFGNIIVANVLWSITNPYMIWYSYKINETSMARMYVIFTIIAWFGMIYWMMGRM